MQICTIQCWTKSIDKAQASDYVSWDVFFILMHVSTLEEV